MTLRCFLVLAGSAVAVFAQDSSPVTTPSDPFYNQRVTTKVMAADRLKFSGKLDEAIAEYKEILDEIRKDPRLKIREEELLQHLASAYIMAQRPKEAVDVSARILSFHIADCQPAAPGIERCADSQYGLGLAMMHAGDFDGAVTQLTAAAKNFGKVPAEDNENSRMVKLKQQGDAESLLAAALFRAGQKEKSIAAFRKTVEMLSTVANNDKIDPGTRSAARKSLTDAQSSLDMILGAK